MLLYFLLIIAATETYGAEECDALVEVKSGEVKELLNPSYPLIDDPEKTCAWTVIAPLATRIILACPLTDWSDTRSDERDHCGATLTVWDDNGISKDNCRDMTFAMFGNSNRMLIKYKNDDGLHYKRSGGFKCYLYSKKQSLFASYDPTLKLMYKPESLEKCNFFIKLGKNEFVRLATLDYTEDGDNWRKCRWTAVSPKDSRISVTCPYTEKPPDPVLMQAEPCTSEFTIRLLQSTITRQCSDKSFAETSTKNRIVFEALSLMRLPKRDFECYIHSESRDEDKPLKPSPYYNCDEYLEFFDVNTTGVIKFPHHSGWIRPGEACRWNVNAPQNAEISLNCTQEDSRRQPDQNKCLGRFLLTTPAGDVRWLCHNSYLKSVFRTKFPVPYNGLTLTYENDNHDAVHPFMCTLTIEENCKDCVDPETIQRQGSRNTIRLHGREVKEILSPHYPEKEGPGSTGRWTVIADLGRQIILVCPFHHSVEDIYTDQDEQPCNGEFVVAPDREDDSIHCRDRGFSRIGRTRRMMFTFKNNVTHSLDAFKCYVYAEVTDRLQWKLDERDYQFAYHEYAITLDGVNVVTLVPPTSPEGPQRRNWKTRWHITSLNDGVVTIACHFTDKPPAPLTIQVVPCTSEFTFGLKEKSVSHNCNERAFSHTDDGWMIFTYRSKGTGPTEDFVCVAYSTNRTTTNEVMDPTDAEKTCDATIFIDDSQIVRLNPTNYTVKTPLDRKYRCWNILAQPNNRIGIVCPPAFLDDARNDESLRCHSQFTVITEIGTQSMHCSDQRFAITSADNRMKIIYEAAFSEFLEPFTCEIYAMETDLKIFPLAQAAKPPFTRNIRLTTESAILESPSFPSTERGGRSSAWAVVSPPGTRIVLTCPSLVNLPQTHQNLDSCLGFAYFTVSSEGEPKPARYCRSSAFIHTSANNTMTVVYQNPSMQESESFRCDLRAFNDSSWNLDNYPKRHSFFYENCDEFVSLTYHSTADLYLPEDYEKGTPCRWRVVSPPGSRIFISCPLREVIPDSGDRCISNYTVITAESVTTHCRADSLSVTSPSNWSVLMYNYPEYDKVDSFACYAYAENQLPDSTCPNCTATVSYQTHMCGYLVELLRGQVKELVNPSYPARDDPERECTWSVIADVDRRIVLVCPFNDGSDTITDERVECGAEMTVWDAGGEPMLYCRDQTFARVGTSNRMFINYTNDDGNTYNRNSGFKCFMYATLASLSQPYDLAQKKTFEDTPFGKCDFVIRLSKYDIVRLATSPYPEDRQKWRSCRWTMISPAGSSISVTCPYTQKPPDPLLIQAEPCTNEFQTSFSQNPQIYQCSDRSFSETSKGNRFVLQQMNIMRRPLRDSECYVHTELPLTSETPKSSPYGKCDHVIELNETTILKTPDNPAPVRSGTTCRWTVVIPQDHQISLNCHLTDDDYKGTPGEICFAEVEATLPGGKQINFCQELGTIFPTIYTHQGVTVIYKNTLSNEGEPFECVVTLLGSANWNQDTDTIDKQKSNKVIKLKKREVMQLLSPNYPSDVPAGSTARWTIVADMDRRIVLVCQFKHAIEKTYKLADKQPCNGKFTVSPDQGEESDHCQDRGFSRIGVNHVMVMTYENQLKEPLEPFICYAYAELKERWDQLENEVGVKENEQKIILTASKVKTLLPPVSPEGEKRLWRNVWNVSAVYESRVTIACHYTDKPPAPITIQVVPCYGQFTLVTIEGNKTHHCNERSFSVTSESGWVVLVYENLQKRPADNFVCVAYSSNKTSFSEVTSLPYENSECDYLVTLDRNEILKLDSTQYDLKKESGRSSCRWTFRAPARSQIAIACPLSTDTPAQLHTLRCHGQFTVFTEGRDKSIHCSETTFSRTSPNNWMTLIYENEFSQSMEPFRCEIYSMLNAADAEFTYVEESSTCTNKIKLQTAQEILMSPNYPSDVEPHFSCTWNVLAPRNHHIILTCPSSNQLPTDTKSNTCSGFAYFTLFPAEDTHSIKYCHRSAFTVTSVKNKMRIVYANPSDKNSEGFKCSLRMEKESPWNECETCKVSVSTSPRYKNCDLLFKLIHQMSIEMTLPKTLAEGASCRWTLVSPPDTRILVSCPDKEIPLDTCSNFYTVSGAGTTTKYCRGEILHQPSPSNWSIFTHENYRLGRMRRFTCFAYAENLVPQEECDNCKGVEKLDYRKCDTFISINETGQLGLLPTPNYPQDLVPGLPCLWRVRSPPLTAITLTCDRLSQPLTDTRCRGLITIYAPGKDPQYMCRHLEINLKSADNKLDIAYGNQFGVTNKPFKCYVQALNTSCHLNIALDRVQYNEFYKVIGPNWNSSSDDLQSCTYSIESPPDTRIFLVCAGGHDLNESMAVSTTGDHDTSQADVFHLRNTFKTYSVKNKMTIVYIMDKTTKPYSQTGCRLYVDREKSLPPVCGCGNKYNKWKSPPPPLRDTVQLHTTGTWSHATTFPMVAAIVRSKPFTVFCFATIISEYHAISAAQCYDAQESFLSNFQSDLTLMVGSHKTGADGLSTQRLIRKYMLHPGYDKNSGQDDIAITFVSEKILFDEYTQPACLPFHDRQRSYDKEKITFLAWEYGDFRRYTRISYYTYRTILNEDVIQKMEGHIGSIDECDNAFDNFNSKAFWCLTFPKNSTTLCPDEKAGPVYWKDPQTGLIKVIGIDISRRGCGVTDHTWFKHFHFEVIPVVNYVDWIQSSIYGLRPTKNHLDPLHDQISAQNITLCTEE